MILPDRIGHVVIKVRNLERSKRFFTDVLGLKLMMELPKLKIAFFASNGRDHHEILRDDFRKVALRPRGRNDHPASRAAGTDLAGVEEEQHRQRGHRHARWPIRRARCN